MFTLLFGDDQLVVANDEEDVAYMITKLIEEYNNWVVKIHKCKKEWIPMRRKSSIQVSHKISIKECANYKHLGSVISKKESIEKDIRNRLN